MFQTIEDVENLAAQKALVRVDFNVNIEEGVVADDRKLTASLPTIEYLADKGAKVILMTHIGRPGGKVVEDLRVDPIAKKLEQLLGKKVKKIDQYQENTQEKTGQLTEGEIAMLENVRFHPDERENSGEYAKDLADLADIFVLDGFGVAHRGHSSISGVAEKLSAYGGLLLKRELANLDKIITGKDPSFSLILGGIKVATKLPVIANLKDKLDHILLGGAMANTVLASQGKNVGGSIIDQDELASAKKLANEQKVELPSDLIVGKKDGSEFREVLANQKNLARAEEMILDIGRETIANFTNIEEKSKTIVFNGAVGHFEQEPYHKGTKAIVQHLVNVARRDDTFVVVGGGETVQSLNLADSPEAIDFISTGGGAMLHYLAGKKLPGLEALGKK
jgi:phosphoglycerate kinase